MSILAQAFDHLLDARQRVVGVREKVKLAGVDVDAIVEAITFDEIILYGGIGENGGYRCQIACTDITGPPVQYSPCIIRGKTLQVLSWEDINGIVYHLTVGDAMKETK